MPWEITVAMMSPTKKNIRKAIEHNTINKTVEERDIYKKFQQMKKRCYSPKCKAYNNYGGRGIKVCDEWRSNFQSFYDWSMSNGYEDGLTIERIDVNGDYCPENCQWIPLSKQMFNKRNNIFLEYEGRILTLKEWSKQEDIFIPYGTILRRYHCGWSAKDILFKETRK